MVAFMEKYIELRGECQESYYNFGRAFHTIGLLQNAAHFYKKALECPVPVQESNSVRKISIRKSTFSSHNFLQNIFDIRPEIAYNLSQIYKSSGSTQLSLYYIHKYCTV